MQEPDLAPAPSPLADTPPVVAPQQPVSTYKVAFNANGGKLPKGKKMAAQKMTYGKATKLRKNVFTRKGYVFIGWAKSKKGAVAYKNAQRVSNLTPNGGTVTLYAKWAKKTYKVAFYANGGKGKMAAQTMTYGKAKKLTANKFTRKGYVFKGWAKSKALAKKGKVAYKNKKAVKNLVTNGKTVKLYAVWKKKASPVVVPSSSESRPANDNFANAIRINVSDMKSNWDLLEYTIRGNNQNATLQSGEPTLIDSDFIGWGYTGAASVWWKWTAPADGGLRMSTDTPDKDHSIALFEGSSLQDLSPLAFSHEQWAEGGFYQSLPSVSVQEGVTYYIAVSSLKLKSNGKCTTGAIKVDMSFYAD